MPNDPHSRRTQPAPPHPSGLRPLDDAPVFVAPAVDVRPSSPARSSLPPPLSGGVLPAGRETDVHFTLSFPVEERKPTMPPPDLEPDLDENAPISEAPETIDWERAARKLAGLPGSLPAAGSLPAGAASAAPLNAVEAAAEAAVDAAEAAALTRDLAAIAALDERADRANERSVAHRTTLARARALRFRLALLQAWPAGAPSPAPQIRSLDLDQSIDAMLLVALADGAPSVFGPASPLPVVSVMVESLRALKPELTRAALRDRGAAAIARLTIVGWKGGIDGLSRSGQTTPADVRSLSMELAARTALFPDSPRGLDPHRLGALQDLERALALPVGSVAAAIEAARRTRARAR